MSRKPWELRFLAERQEVAGLRRVLRIHLGIWGLDELVDAAQLCVSELVSNVITHVGPGTPTTLAVSMKGTRLRIEVHDPDTRALPTLLNAGINSETGRGMELVTFVTDRWGVQLLADRKVTWCELATSLTSPNGHRKHSCVTRAEQMLELRCGANLPTSTGSRRLSAVTAEEAVIAAIADLLHWLRAHGCDADDVLDRAQMHFEAEAEAAVRGLSA
ncbi:ATP-binding protein [Streptomyces sp. AK08-02]|uniref:ATP-binding protein n=1 Tax=Streptomyces sp. AK08-02 TaxID=3028654 RepID=UPI0029A22438|nr:ATP-binding protein [Streptomyces sp. AK08-02]MDX3747554.1 ATP-binding protein [Streptomyces sp. AK08-02]